MVNLKTCFELGQTVHISDIKLPEGVESVALAHGSDHDSAVAKIIKPKFNHMSRLKI